MKSKKVITFQVFPDTAHPAELEQHQLHNQLDGKFPYLGAHGRLTDDTHDKNWIPLIGINKPSNCKAEKKTFQATKK